MAEKRKPEESVKSFFVEKKIRSEDGSETTLSFCKLCGDAGKPFKCVTVWNLKRHLVSKHREEASKHDLVAEGETMASAKVVPAPRMKKISYHIDRNDYSKCLVQWVTECNVSLNFFSKKCVRKVLNPINKELKLPQSSRQNCHNSLEVSEEKTRKFITELLKARMICIKADIASRKGRVVLGINAQVIINGEVVVVTLAMLERFDRNTAENIVAEVMKVLKKFEIDIRHVYSITTDNGSNFIKAAEILRQKIIEIEQDVDENDCDQITEIDLDDWEVDEFENNEPSW